MNRFAEMALNLDYVQVAETLSERKRELVISIRTRIGQVELATVFVDGLFVVLRNGSLTYIVMEDSGDMLPVIVNYGAKTIKLDRCRIRSFVTMWSEACESTSHSRNFWIAWEH
jgi:hypothetical protein